MSKLFSFIQRLKQFPEALKTQIAITALNHYKSKFIEGNGQWEGEKWKEPQRKRPMVSRKKSVQGKRSTRLVYRKGRTQRDATRATLVKTGALARSLRFDIKPNKIVFSSNKKYGKVHNEGGQAGRGKGFKMPKRQFLGMEKALLQKLKNAYRDELRKLSP